MLDIAIDYALAKARLARPLSRPSNPRYPGMRASAAITLSSQLAVIIEILVAKFDPQHPPRTSDARYGPGRHVHAPTE